MSESEQLNELADKLCGYREASFELMIERANSLLVSERLLKTTDEAVSKRQDLYDAIEALKAEIDSLFE